MTRWTAIMGYLCAAMTIAGTVPAAGGGDGSGGAVDRILATERAAVASSPSLAAARAGVAARSSESRAGAAAGSPYLELQQEGIGSGLDWAGNAQTTLRIGKPFNLPSHGKARRELGETATAWADAAARAAALETAEAAGNAWIGLAALEDRLDVARRRLERLRRALDLQRVRLELGEVAGTDVSQVELAWANVLSTVRKLEASRDAAREALRRHCGDRCVFPRAGDLAQLERATRTVDPGPDEAAFVERSPAFSRWGLEAALDERDARVMEATAWGRPEAELEWEHVPGMDGLPSSDAFGVRFRIPLPAGSAGSQLREAAAARRLEARARRTEARARTLARLRKARAEARSAEATLHDLAPVLGTVDHAEHSLAEQFRLGAISYLVYIDGASRFDDLALEAVDARASLVTARLTLAALAADANAFPLPEIPSGTAEPETKMEMDR